MRFILLLNLALLSFALPAFAGEHAAPVFTYEVVHSYPHDPKAFTQGLIFLNGHLYESTGLSGNSSLRMVDLESGRVLQQAALPEEDFAEGLAAWDNRLVQLTWMSHKALVYDRFSFRLLQTLHYPGEGWGLTSDGRSLILSDGTATLRFLDPGTFRENRHVMVKSGKRQVKDLNELEFVKGEIYANIWHSDKIVRISPRTGKVVGWIDLSGLLPDAQRADTEAVLNGIAYDPEHDRLFVTGKLWPKIIEIRVHSKTP